MNITFRPIDRSNVHQCLALTVAENQQDFVASNAFSLAEAAYNSELNPLAIYRDEQMVGFLLYDFDLSAMSWSMSRLMIDRHLQHQGIGKAALTQFIRLFKQKHGNLALCTSAAIDNPVAIALYESAGFHRGEVFEYLSGGKTYREVRLTLG